MFKKLTEVLLGKTKYDRMDRLRKIIEISPFVLLFAAPAAAAFDELYSKKSSRTGGAKKSNESSNGASTKGDNGSEK